MWYVWKRCKKSKFQSRRHNCASENMIAHLGDDVCLSLTDINDINKRNKYGSALFIMAMLRFVCCCDLCWCIEESKYKDTDSEWWWRMRVEKKSSIRYNVSDLLKMSFFVYDNHFEMNVYLKTFFELYAIHICLNLKISCHLMIFSFYFTSKRYRLYNCIVRKYLSQTWFLTYDW